MGNPPVIALVGQTGSGKSEVARHLVINHNYTRIRFAGRSAWKVRVAACLMDGYKVVCDDCRFMNEMETVHTFHGAEIWRILRKGLPTRMEHSSEKGDLPFDRTIKNYGSIGELKTAVDGLLL